MGKQELNVSGFSYKFEKRCEAYEEAKEDKNLTELMLGSDIAKKAGYYWEGTVYDSITLNSRLFFSLQHIFIATQSTLKSL